MSESNGVATVRPRTFPAAGHVWLLEINAYTVKQVRLKTGVEVGKWTGRDTIQKMLDLFADVERFVDVLFVLCEDQARERQISDAAFGRGMAGDAIEQAAEAFWGAFADFCRSQGRGVMLALLAKLKAADDLATKTTTAALNAVAVEEMVRRLTAETEGMIPSPTSKPSAGSSPGSSASSPEG